MKSLLSLHGLEAQINVNRSGEEPMNGTQPLRRGPEYSSAGGYGKVDLPALAKSAGEGWGAL